MRFVQYLPSAAIVLLLCLPAVGQDPAKTTSQESIPKLDELFLFFPSKHPSGNWAPKGLKFKDVWFSASDGTRIHGWYCPVEKPRATVLYLHGNAGNLTHRAKILTRLQTEQRFTTLIFDYRGYGRSEGTPSVAGMLDDARAARRFLAKAASVRESQIVLMGRSLGGAVAVELAAQSPPRGLILESTFSSLREVAGHHYPKLGRLVSPNKLNSVSRIAGYKRPLLQSHGEKDRTIPFSMGRKLFDAAKGPKQFVAIPSGTHNSRQPDHYYRELKRFVANLPD